MIKHTSNNDFDFQIESVSLVRDISTDLTKRASAKSLLKFNKTAGQEDLHIIALGSYEGIGFNRNGDSFPEKDCRNNHHYFVKSARAVHRHHKNKPSDPKYGNIKASAYNESMKRIELIVGLDIDKCADILDEQEKTGNTCWSMACFTAGTPVKLASGMEKDIDKIEIGDEVITHLGKSCKVSDKFSKAYNDIAIKFKATGAAESIFCTKNHPIWARVKPTKNSPCPVCGKKYAVLKAHLRQHKDIKHQYALNNLDKMFEGWVNAENLNVGDCVITPFDTTVGDSTVSESYAKLLGWYLAEGHFYNSKNVKVSSHCLDFTLNITEDGFAAEIIQLLKDNNVLAKDIRVYKYIKSNKQVVRCRDLAIANQLVIDGGKYSYTKKLNKQVLQWPPNIQKYIIEKWLEGDDTLNKYDSTLKGITVSRALMYDLCTLAYRNGLIPLVTKHLGKNRPSYTITFTANESNQLNVSKRKIEFIAKSHTFDLGKLKDWQKGQYTTVVANCKRSAYIEGNRVYRRVNKISREFLSAEVYDITVIDDHSFTVSGIAVHNSKQAHDVCSWCGHKATTDADRCEHIPKNLGEINKQGEMCGMQNPNPRWFEISYVRRPADRIGMSLGKMASANVIQPMLPRDFLNIYGDIYVPEDIYISKKAADKRDLLKKLAELEKHVDTIAKTTPKSSKDKFIKEHAHKLNKGKKIDHGSMDELRKHEPNTAFKGLADKGVILNPEDFSKYVFGNRIDKNHVDGMKSHLPDIYSQLDKDNDSTVTNDEKFEPSGNVKPDLKHVVNGLTTDHSLEGKPAMQRMMIITIIMGSPDKGLKASDEIPKTKEAFDKEFAKQYATYKLAALNYINEQGKLDEDILLNSIIQNRG